MPTPMIVLADRYMEAVGHLEFAESLYRSAASSGDRQAARLGAQNVLDALDAAANCHRAYWRAVALRMREEAVAAATLIEHYRRAARAGGLPEEIATSTDVSSLGDIPLEAPDLSLVFMGEL